MLELGQQLKAARELRNISLEEIAEATKVNTQYLSNIEAGNWDFLPEAYVRGIIRKIATYIGIDGDAFLRKYDFARIEALKTEEMLSASQIQKNQQETQFGRWGTTFSLHKIRKEAVIAALSLIVLLILIIIYIKFKAFIFEPSNATVAEIPVAKEVPTDSNFASSFALENNHFSLLLKVIDETWLQISVDDSTPVDYIFTAGQVREWKAAEKFNIRLGNAAGIEIFLEGEKLPFKGRKNQVLNLEINRNGLIPK